MNDDFWKKYSNPVVLVQPPSKNGGFEDSFRYPASFQGLWMVAVCGILTGELTVDKMFAEGGAIPFASVAHPERCWNTQGTNPLSDKQCFMGYDFWVVDKLPKNQRLSTTRGFLFVSTLLFRGVSFSLKNLDYTLCGELKNRMDRGWNHLMHGEASHQVKVYIYRFGEQFRQTQGKTLRMPLNSGLGVIVICPD